MISTSRQIFQLAACLGSSVFLWFPAPAATPTNTPLASETAAALLPKLKSPVDTFRELLAMNLSERKQYLTNRPPENQKRIMAKLVEYESLKADERELRLSATELQWYLLPLMHLPATNRAARLALIPDGERKLVETRLKRWDLLPSNLQQQLLNDEMTAYYFAQLGTTDLTNVLARMSPERRAKLEEGLDRWRGLTEEQRRKTLDQFNAFFELTAAEKQKVMNQLSEAEQRQMEKTLQAYAELPEAKRRQCITSFEKFTGMSLGERQLFLKNARRWKLMSPADRETWRKLVRLAPLYPPALPQADRNRITALATN